MKRNNDSNSGIPIQYSPESLIKNTACDLGFSLAGITGVSPSPESDLVFDKWIREGKHGEMRYLSGGADKRHDPGLLLDGAKSIICVAVNHYSEKKEKRIRDAAREKRGRVAVYAQGRDYHEIMMGMLGEFEIRLKDFFPDLKAKAVVDTQPISERDLAIKSGIAWLGKNTCVISPQYGSWIFLGALITNLTLEPGQPLRSLCGNCTKCIAACPTGALDEFSLDSNKCISYLTIEKRGDIPDEFRRPIGQHLFGCDECQRVCPFNRFAKESLVFDGLDSNPIVDMMLEDLAGISDEAFKGLAHLTAIRRCKSEGLRRNARIVLENRSYADCDGEES